MNKAFITGNIAKDLEVKRTNSGKSYLRIIVASRRDKDHADFISCVAWEKRAEVIAQYFKKGDQIILGGSIRVEEFEGQNGKQYQTYVLIDEFDFGRKVEPKQTKYQEQNFLDAPRNEMPTHNNIEIDSSELPFY